MPEIRRYLRVSLINQCNLGCFYCKPNGLGDQAVNWISPLVFRMSIDLLHRIGVRKVRFTGGEPTLYKELPHVVSFTKSLSADMYTAITTNGLLLNRLARPLAEAGLDSANISLDTADRGKFARITGADRFNQVIAAIETARKHIPKVKLNCVVMAGINDDETESMILLADSLGVDIRFIEFMPSKHAGSSHDMFVSGPTLRASLPFDLTPIQEANDGAARYFRSDRFRIRIGFIEPVSNPFCVGCNRIRLTSDGRLFNCLFSSRHIDLAAALTQDDDLSLRLVRRFLSDGEQPACGIGKRRGDLPSFLNIGG